MLRNDDSIPSTPMQTAALPGTLRIRNEINIPQCAIADCDEPPTERLPENMQVRNLIWCTAHVDLIAREIAKRNYRDFVQGMRQEGIQGEPIAQQFTPVEDRRCSIPRCKRGTITGSDLFSPYKSPGMVWVCALHCEILQHVVRNQNGRRVIHELWIPRNRKPDPERRSRKKAILSAYAKCHGKPRYIECVCLSLQKARIRMPAKWVERWEKEFNLRYEPFEWLRAYQEKRIRSRIQRHVSRICKTTLRNDPK